MQITVIFHNSPSLHNLLLSNRNVFPRLVNDLLQLQLPEI